MKKEILYLLLAVSLAFNLAFIGMFIWHRLYSPLHNKPPEFEKIRRVFENHPEPLREMRREFVDRKCEFWDYLHGENYDEAEADSLLKKMLRHQMAMEEALGRRLIDLKNKGELPYRPGNLPGIDERRKPERRRK
jgi:hypothetical protein